jgi:hypothetical protein
MEELLTAKETKKILKVSLPLVYKLADQKRIPCVRWDCPGKGKKKPRSMLRFKIEDVLNFIEEHYTTT